MALSRQQAAFARRIGHEFARPELLQEALTHPSMSSATRSDNQRFEFLGDRVLGLAIAEALLEADPAATEGQLAPRFNALVRKETCADVARELDLGVVLKFGRSEMMSGGRRRDASLGDGLEAVIAAVHLDGGFDAARALIRRLWAERIAEVESDARDPKSALQEYAQGRKQPPPRYVVDERSGPDHAPVFTITAILQSGEQAQAQAGSKRQAEQAAAKALLDAIQNGQDGS